jgi:hypothetical protein
MKLARNKGGGGAFPLHSMLVASAPLLPPDFLLTLVALVNSMRLSLRESRIRGSWECREAGNLGTLRSELVTF